MCNKIAVFPIDYSNVSIARFLKNEHSDVKALITPGFEVLDGFDLSKIDGGEYADIKLCSQYKKIISECSEIMFIKSNMIKDKTIYKELICYANDLNKKTMIADKVLQQEPKEALNYDYMTKCLLHADVPIISILEIGDNCGQLQTELAIREYFTAKNYKVVYIGSDDNCKMVGGYNIPEFLYDLRIDNVSKIKMFNKFVYDTYINERPDLIVIGIPTPIMRYNDMILNGFGMLPFIMQNAIKSDIAVLSLYYGEYTYEYLYQLMQLSKYRFDVPCKYFSIGNAIIARNIDDLHKLDYLFIDNQFVMNHINYDIENNEFTLFSPYIKESLIRALDKIENELLMNPEKV